MKTWDRRSAVKAVLVSGAAALWPWRWLFAQSSTTLLQAAKQALVIGNSKYKQVPLKNPLNDARGMADALKSGGFAVTLGLELTQAGMRDAIAAYANNLAKAKAVGLFYFAGHGAQLAWRNYLIPVDADVVNVDEVRERCVDLNSLIEGIKRAGNPMNIIILDACRDNPFGSISRLDQKGLSQLDAPPGTLLAYATAPGNTAIDGEGDNGLYTENLLREIKVPETKVEDVFKRVRLAVRLRSNGLQIPWESTSLEEDFWFIPPKELKNLAEAEIEREFKQELALWEKIQKATQPAPFEEYLRRYPSGRFAELAQFQLDRVLAALGEKKVEVVSAPQNPYTKGTARADTAFNTGDRYTYRRFDPITKIEGKPFTRIVANITENEVIFGNGSFVTDLLGNVRKSGDDAWWPNQTVPTEFIVGKRWKTRFRAVYSGGRNPWDSIVDLELLVADREKITVPAGSFNAFRVEARGWRFGTGGVAGSWNWKRWYAPDQVRLEVASETLVRGGYEFSNRVELVRFRQS